MRNNLLRSRKTEVLEVNAVDDKILVESCRKGDDRAVEQLLTKYKSLVSGVARSYFIVGADDEDLVQEGMIALYKAIGSYDTKSEVPFSAYACSCIKNRLLDAIKSANRDKHKALNSYVPIYEIGEGTFVSDSAEDRAIRLENSIQVKKTIAENLTKDELRVLSLYLRGQSYRDIATEVGKSEKSVDNVLQKIKKKIRSVLDKG